MQRRSGHRAPKLRISLALASAGLLFASALHADSLTLKDGSLLEGVIRQVDGGYQIATANGAERFVATEDVKSIKLSNEGKVTPGNARERLQSLQRSVENERDLSHIIDKYEQFITMNANTDAAGLAQAELDQWRARRDRNMVKVGRDWMTPVERDQKLIAAAKRVEDVCGMLSAGQFDAASAALRTGLDEEPDNVSYLYLSGVLQIQRSQFNEAKRSFDSVLAQVTDHVPTLFNEAVLAAQFKRWPQAIAGLDQAITLAPGQPEILEGVLAFSQIAPESAQRTPPFERLMQKFGPQEADLEQRMAGKGLYRLGSRWVDKATIDKANAEQAAYEKTKSDMDADYHQTQDRVHKIDEQIATVERLLQQMERDSVYVDRDGTVINRGLPPAYWDSQRDLDNLKTQRKTEQTHTEELKKKAADVERTAPKLPGVGRMEPIGVNGVPIVLPAHGSPATRTAEENVLIAGEIRITTVAATQPTAATRPSGVPTTQPAGASS